MDVLSANSILCGLAIANGATIITIPAGKTWVGVVTISGCVAVGTGGGQALASARVATAGATVTPPAGEYGRLDLVAPASVLAAIGTAAEGSVHVPLVVAAGANPATLVFNFTGMTAASASASGFILFGA